MPHGQLSQYNGSEIRPRNVNVAVCQGFIFTGWSLDGANVTNFELGGTLILPNFDAMQEFTVLSALQGSDRHVRGVSDYPAIEDRLPTRAARIGAATVRERRPLNT